SPTSLPSPSSPKPPPSLSSAPSPSSNIFTRRSFSAGGNFNTSSIQSNHPIRSISKGDTDNENRETDSPRPRRIAAIIRLRQHCPCRKRQDRQPWRLPYLRLG